MSFKNFFKTLKSNFKKKIIFFENIKYDVLVVDKGLSNINLSEICKYKTIKDEIYFFCLVKALFKCLINFEFKFYKLSIFYLDQLIKKFDTKILIGNDFNSKLFEFKGNKKIKTIVYQFSDHEIENKKVLKRILVNKYHQGDIYCDYYLLKHKLFEQTVKFINAKFIEVGSVKNNEIETTQFNQKKYDIMLISQYRNPYKFFGIYNPKIMYINDSAMWFVAKSISNFCEKNNKNFCIATTFNRSDKKKYNIRDKEIDFYSSISNNFKTEDIDSYNLAEKCKVIVTTYSTLGLELLSRGKRVLFLDPFYFLGGNYINMFTEENSGSHWYTGHDEKEIFEKIKYLENLKDVEWNKIFNSSPFKIKFDKKNKILKDIIKNNLN